MEELIGFLKDNYRQYKELVEANEGAENPSHEDSEDLGAFIGKMEMCETLLDKFGPSGWRETI